MKKDNSSKIIREEPVLFFLKDGRRFAKVAFEIENLIKIENPTKGEILSVKDFVIDGRELRTDKEISSVFQSEWLQGKNLPNDLHADLRFNVGDILLPIPQELVAYQYWVTYQAKETPQYPNILKYADNLVRVKEKLQKGENITILIYGDSISNAANSSWQLELPPYRKPWYERAAEKISERYGCEVSIVNNSKSGYPSSWGVENLEEKVVKVDFDLIVEAFGMNDGSADIPTEIFEENVKKIITAKPNISAVLVSSILPNEESNLSFYGLRMEYRRSLNSLCQTCGCALIDMTAISEFFQEKKLYAEISGNNFNHPNDFIYNFYANALIDLLCD